MITNKYTKTKGQASIEYLIILGIALFLLVPVVTLFYNSTRSTQVSAVSREILLAGTEMVATAERVFYQSTGSRVRIDITMPTNVQNITLRDNNRTLVITADMQGLSTDFVFFSTVPLGLFDCDGTQNEDLHTPGRKTLFVKSCGRFSTLYVTTSG
ncbi:MAG: hypothetical protein ACMXYK_00545 [Candidatus Woesearchaeota archaeon]